MSYTLSELARALGARLEGDGAMRLTGVASLGSATPSELSFAEDEASLEQARASSAGALVTGEFALPALAAKALLISSQPRLTFARAAALLCPPPAGPEGIHPTAVIESSARLASGVAVGPRAVICAEATIGNRTRIGAGAYVGRGVVIGTDCDVKPNVVIYPGTRLGARVVIHAGAVLGSDGFGYVRDRVSGHYEKFPQIGRLEIEDDVEIGANAAIDRGALDATVISRGVKIDNLVHVGHNVQIGEDVVIAAQTGISGSVVIERDVIMGGQVGIGDHARVEAGTILGGQAGVLNGKVLRGKGMLFWGTPARPVREYLKELATLTRLARKK